MINELTVTFKFETAAIRESEMGQNFYHEDRSVLHELMALLKDVHHHQGRILRNQEKIMTAISDYAAKVKASFTTIGNSLDAIEDDIKTLADKITEMQNNPGPITAADQTLLDEAEVLANGLVARVGAIDAQHPPVPTA